MAQYDRFHREIPDKTPVAMPLGYERPEPLESMIARMIRVESVKAQKEGKETFEESDDFDCDDDDIKFTSEHQFTDLQEEEIDNPKPKQRQTGRPDSQSSAPPTASPKPAAASSSSPTPGETPSEAAQQTGEKPQPMGQRPA